MSPSFSSHVTFHGNSSVKFNNSKPVMMEEHCQSLSNTTLIFRDNSNVTFINEAYGGGAVYCDRNCINGHTKVLFNANRAMIAGGTLFSLVKRKFNYKITAQQSSRWGSYPFRRILQQQSHTTRLSYNSS